MPNNAIEIPNNQSDAEHIPPAVFSELCARIQEHCGIVLKDGKQDLVRARVAKLVREAGHADVANYLRHVLSDTNSKEFHTLVDALSTNLTSFFRENHHFEYLRKDFLPALFRKRLSTHAPLKVRGWSAGCSTGEEPYSIAITVLETLGESTMSWDVKVLATDISSRVLQTASRGIYEKNRTSGIMPPTKQRFFNEVGKTKLQASNELRSRIVFNYLNLQNPWPFKGPFDFIFCRNVMIYFDRPTQERLVNRFYDVLMPGGIFFTGHSESLAGIRHRFKYVSPTIYSK